MSIRELPQMLLQEFCPDAKQTSVRDTQQNKGEAWEGSLAEGAGIAIYEDLCDRKIYLKVWRQKDSGIQNDRMHRPALFEICILPDCVGHNVTKDNIYQDLIVIRWPTFATNLREEPCISIVCKMVARAQELIQTGVVYFPTYCVSSETTDGVKNPT